MDKYLIQLQKRDDWDVCDYLIVERSFWRPNPKELRFSAYKKGHRYDYTLQNFFEFDYNKFCHHMEEDQDTHQIFAQCCNRNHEAMIIPCSENNIKLPEGIKYDTIKVFIGCISIPDDENNIDPTWGRSLTGKYDINYTHPLILQIFESFWEELQIDWAP